jgi:hypothetical protein
VGLVPCGLFLCLRKKKIKIFILLLAWHDKYIYLYIVIIQGIKTIEIMVSFRKVKFEMERLSGYGQYLIKGTYKGKEVKVRTTDSEAWDWLKDESNPEKHVDAKRHCYKKIVQAYNEQY